MRHKLLISARSMLYGWAALIAITYLIERPLLRFGALILGLTWTPTVQLAVACAGLVLIGWIVGHGNRWDVLLFAGILAIWNFGLVPIDLPWLFRLLVNLFGNTRYLESFVTSLVTYVFLLGSLFVGAQLSRGREQAILRIK